MGSASQRQNLDEASRAHMMLVQKVRLNPSSGDVRSEVEVVDRSPPTLLYLYFWYISSDRRAHCGSSCWWQARHRIRAQRPTHEQDVGLRTMDHVVHPATALLHADATPLALREHPALGRILGNMLRENDVAVLELAVVVLLRVFDLLSHLICRDAHYRRGRSN
eukprot:CAMPEP_0174713484 /NCGR_PEP_ID=MMETSP1094-20130205/14137_1 /TAXON_ID=156173 /ORGANISM="Chrysochromulina brevifilum, Strain UTEX LB 985" /LENGTH=163 /DNA_ID=CAMNT_0015912665 /DNA_START=106 /DNA_END=595 /DNA_ORIENTATION=+